MATIDLNAAQEGRHSAMPGEPAGTAGPNRRRTRERRARALLVRTGIPVVVLIITLIGLRWLGFALWHYGAAGPLTARSTPLASEFVRTDEIDLGNGLALTKFSTSEAGMQLHVVHRAGEESARPTLFLIDSSAWQDASDDGLRWLAEGWAQHGFTVITVGHRPSDVASFPGPAEDVTAGIEFALDLGIDYDVDPTRVGLLGASAGGHLATYVGYRASEVIAGIQVRAVVNIYGPTDFRYIADDKLGHSWYRVATLVYAPELGLTEDVNQFLGCNMLRRDCRDSIVQASPITYVTAEVAPTMIVQGKQDDATPWRQATRLEEALLEAGVDVELILDPEMGHELDPMYLEPITRFLDNHLHSP